jgi:Arc/MetJ-type ribon-helix-helix transcriptional regulator
MSNIKRVTIVLSDPMVDRIREALAAGAFTISHETIQRAARRWSAARERPAIEAPSIAADQSAAPALHQPG